MLTCTHLHGKPFAQLLSFKNVFLLTFLLALWQTAVILKSNNTACKKGGYDLMQDTLSQDVFELRKPGRANSEIALINY